MATRGCPLITCLILMTANAASTITQFASLRFYTTPSSSTPRAAFPSLPVEPARQLVPATHTDTLVLSAGGHCDLVTATGNSTPVLGLPAVQGDPRIGTFGLTVPNSFGLTMCAQNGCSWYSCESMLQEARCTSTGSFAAKLGAIDQLHVDWASGNVWLSSAAGLFKAAREPAGSPVQAPVQFGRGVAGNVTALAVHVDRDDAGASASIAVSTTLAVYYDLDESSCEFIHHELVGAGIDAPPTSLVYIRPSPTSLVYMDAYAPSASAYGRPRLGMPELWIGHEYCLNVLRADGTVDRVSGPEGLPVANVTSLHAGAEAGTIWIGSSQGLVLRCPACDDTWRYFRGDRWLSGGVGVNALSPALTTSPHRAHTSAAALPAAWIATAGGLSFIHSYQTTLEHKAALYTARVTALSRHRWVAANTLARYGDTSISSLEHHDGDNDGLWTGMLVAAHTFNYATTGSVSAASLAWHHFAAVEFLHNVTLTDGFIARSAVKCGESHQKGDRCICDSQAPLLAPPLPLLLLTLGVRPRLQWHLQERRPALVRMGQLVSMLRRRRQRPLLWPAIHATG